MTMQGDKLERDILLLFKRACRQHRLDVAEHLLCALEAAQEKSADQKRLREAYLVLGQTTR
ncbi:hypothetical protein AU381_25900 [Sinorhizobium glycinis]|uniref:Uncharacterized protein n=1 Tax=Sinorhizobium glycinis TaxID=1472378 RepID=A0A178XKQ4_9HYPH|nr:hypothetical protein AU381_25900 [Sinorhizobium glycinis]